MSHESDKKRLDKLSLSAEQEEEVLSRCFGIINDLNEMAINIIIDFIRDIQCPVAKQVLLNRPEHLALKAFEKALRDQTLRKEFLQFL